MNIWWEIIGLNAIKKLTNLHITMKTEFLDKRLERLEQLNLLRDLDFEEGCELAEIKRIKQLIIDSVSKRFLL